MGDKSSIQWTDATWNPIRGCSRVSEGCRNCYAERVAARFSGPGLPYEGLVTNGLKRPRWNGTVRMVPEHLADPLRWKKPRRVFVNSMSDLFHEALADEQIALLFAIMAAAPQHTFQVLPKRPERMRAWLDWIETASAWGDTDRNSPTDVLTDAFSKCDAPMPAWVGEEGVPAFSAIERAGWPLRNVWLGVSVEDQRTADERIPLLLDTPAALRWVSYEPALGPVDFGEWIARIDHCTSCHEERPPLGPDRCPACGRGGTLTSTFGERQRRELVEGARYDTPSGDPRADGPELHWIVVGGESGPGARAFDLAWARSVIEQGRTAGVPVFVKQLGARPHDGDPCDDARAWWPGPHTSADGCPRFADRAGGDMDEWPSDLQVRQFPEVRS